MLRVTLTAISLLGAAAAQAPGERFVLTPESRLFLPAHLPRAGEPLDVVLHMHGDHRLVQDAFFGVWKHAALLSVHIDGFSSVYTRFFGDRQALQRLLDRAEIALQTRRPVDGSALTGNLALTAFSAGYAGVREILATPAYRPHVRAVVLGDGLHTGYVNGNQVDPAQMIDFVAFARDAAAGTADFRFSHSAIVPGTYASTTQCADFLIAALAAARSPWSGTNELGMTRVSRCERARFAVHGFAGNQAADHVQHFRYLWWMLLDTSMGAVPAVLPMLDRFPPAGREQPAWQHKFAQHSVQRVNPAAPRGDGFALVVKDPAGGYDTARLGPLGTADCAVEAPIWCEHRPQLAADGYERIGLFVRDDGNGGFEGSTGGGGSCYAFTWDSHDGRVRALKVVRGLATELAPSPLALPSTAWRTFRIEAVGTALRFYVDGSLVLHAADATFARGQAGIGHHEYFATNSLAQGTRAESFRLEAWADDRR